jgi:2-oxoglutarate ferredoxin oxidoreductase subunit gamma
MMSEYLFSGFGGQGVMFAGQLLAYAAMDSGLEVTWIPSYGPEMRGGTAHCLVVIADHPIGAPLVAHPQIAIVFNAPSFDKYEPLVAEGGLLVVNSSLVPQKSRRADLTHVCVDATQIADKLGDTHLANMVLLGAALTARPVLPLDAIERALDAHLPERRRHLLPLNLQALGIGAGRVQSVLH